MTYNQVERIEAYLEGKMEPGERRSFEQALASDRALAAAYDTYRNVERYMQNGKKQAGDGEVKSTLAKLGAEFLASAQTSGSTAPRQELRAPAPGRLKPVPGSLPSARTIPYGRLAAAVILGIVMTGTWLLLKDKSNGNKGNGQVAAAPAKPPVVAGRQAKAPDTATQRAGSPAPVKEKGTGKPKAPDAAQQKRLFAAYFSPDTVPAQQEALLEEAFVQYESRHYQLASAAFENAALDLSARGREDDSPLPEFYASYYRAISLQALGKDAQAIRQLQRLNSSDPVLQAKVSWYLALSYVRAGKPQQALPLLSKLHENEAAGQYRQKAASLMAELE